MIFETRSRNPIREVWREGGHCLKGVSICALKCHLYGLEKQKLMCMSSNAIGQVRVSSELVTSRRPGKKFQVQFCAVCGPVFHENLTTVEEFGGSLHHL